MNENYNEMTLEKLLEIKSEIPKRAQVVKYFKYYQRKAGELNYGYSRI